MPTAEVVNTPTLPIGEADDSRTMLELLGQLNTIFSNRGAALNSLINGQFNEVHFFRYTQPLLAGGGTSNQLDIPGGVTAVRLATTAGGHTVNGIKAPNGATNQGGPGRFLMFFNVGVAGSITFSQEALAAVAEDRIIMTGGPFVLPVNGVTRVWYDDLGGLAFPEGRWRLG